jgi:hypothetical protein
MRIGLVDGGNLMKNFPIYSLNPILDLSRDDASVKPKQDHKLKI